MGVPKAVFLDVGWTLVYPRQSMWEILAALGREAGTEMTAEGAEGRVHALMEGARARAVAEFEAGAQYTDSDEEFAAQFVSLARLVFGAAGIAGDHAALSVRFLERFWTRENWAVFPDVIDGMERLRRGGVRLGVLSNAGSELVSFLEQLDLLRRFDFTIVSAVEGTKKPDRRIFERALRRAGTDPAEAVHVGDMYLEDLLGARQVGVRALLMDRGGKALFPNHSERAGLAPGDGFEVVTNLHEVVAAIGLE